MKTFNPKHIIGKRVAAVEMNPFRDGLGGTAHRPAITFEDGSSIRFLTQETDNEYGTQILYRPSRTKRVR